MNLTPLAVALQGIGFASLLTSLQGLLAVTVAPDPVQPTPGALTAPRPKRHAVRWRSMAAVPAPWELIAEQSRDEDELLALGAL